MNTTPTKTRGVPQERTSNAPDYESSITVSQSDARVAGVVSTVSIGAASGTDVVGSRLISQHNSIKPVHNKATSPVPCDAGPSGLGTHASKPAKVSDSTHLLLNRLLEKEVIKKQSIYMGECVLTTRLHSGPKLDAPVMGNGKNALFYALDCENNELLRILIDVGVNVNHICNDESALHYAVKKNNAEAVQRLLGAEANKDWQDKEDNTALIVAVNQRLFGMANALIKANVNLDIQGKDGMTALMCSVIYQSRNQLDDCREIVTALIESGADVNLCNDENCAALYYASYHGHTEIVKMLIKNGADIDRQNIAGITSLMMAVDGGNIELVKFLVDKGANVGCENTEGKTAFALACDNGDQEMALDLIEWAGIQRLEPSALLRVLSNADERMVDVALKLIDCGADLDLVDQDGFSALMKAMKNGFESVTRALIVGGADLTFKNERNETALLLALKRSSESKNTKLAGQLIAAGAYNFQCLTNGYQELFDASFGDSSAIDCENKKQMESEVKLHLSLQSICRESIRRRFRNKPDFDRVFGEGGPGIPVVIEKYLRGESILLSSYKINKEMKR